ncbi:hypothetical protein ACW4TU_18680 [Streptomyces sp. QTS52]
MDPLIEVQYFGWQPLTHTLTCPNPVWDTVELRHDDGIRTPPTATDTHTCTHNGCTHANTFDRVQIRLLCRDCDTVHLVRGEGHGQTAVTTADTGWGQQPTRHGEMWLWPGQPDIPGGNPHDYLVTRTPNPITPGAVYGLIAKYRDSEGAPRWVAGAKPDPDGAHYVSSLRFRHRSAGLHNLDEAAAWITTADTRPQRPLVVHV